MTSNRDRHSAVSPFTQEAFRYSVERRSPVFLKHSEPKTNFYVVMQVKPKEKRLDSTVKKHKKPLKSNDEIVKMCIRM